jgi:hypothetical protein
MAKDPGLSAGSAPAGPGAGIAGNHSALSTQHSTNMKKARPKSSLLLPGGADTPAVDWREPRAEWRPAPRHNSDGRPAASTRHDEIFAFISLRRPETSDRSWLALYLNWLFCGPLSSCPRFRSSTLGSRNCLSCSRRSFSSCSSCSSDFSLDLSFISRPPS